MKGQCLSNKACTLVVKYFFISLDSATCLTVNSTNNRESIFIHPLSKHLLRSAYMAKHTIYRHTKAQQNKIRDYI